MAGRGRGGAFQAFGWDFLWSYKSSNSLPICGDPQSLEVLPRGCAWQRAGGRPCLCAWPGAPGARVAEGEARRLPKGSGRDSGPHGLILSVARGDQMNGGRGDFNFSFPGSHRQTLKKWSRCGRASFYCSVSSGNCITPGTQVSASTSVERGCKTLLSLLPKGII